MGFELMLAKRTFRNSLVIGPQIGKGCGLEFEFVCAYGRISLDLDLQPFDLSALRSGQGFRREVDLNIAQGMSLAGEPVASGQFLRSQRLLFVKSRTGDRSGYDLYFATTATPYAAADADQVDAELTGAFQ